MLRHFHSAPGNSVHSASGAVQTAALLSHTSPAQSCVNSSRKSSRVEAPSSPAARSQMFLHFNGVPLPPLRHLQAPTTWGHPEVHHAQRRAAPAESRNAQTLLRCLPATNLLFLSREQALLTSPPRLRVQEIRLILNSCPPQLPLFQFLLLEGEAGTRHLRPLECPGALEATDLVP